MPAWLRYHSCRTSYPSSCRDYNPYLSGLILRDPEQLVEPPAPLGREPSLEPFPTRSGPGNPNCQTLPTPARSVGSGAAPRALEGATAVRPVAVAVARALSGTLTLPNVSPSSTAARHPEDRVEHPPPRNQSPAAVVFFGGEKGSGGLAIAARSARSVPPRGDTAAERPRVVPNHNVWLFLRMFARRRQQLGTTVAGAAPRVLSFFKKMFQVRYKVSF